MERGVWVEQGAFEELCLLVRDLAICHRRIVDWLDRRASGAGGVVTQPVAMVVPPRRGRRHRSVRCAASAGDVAEADEVMHSREVVRALGYIEGHYGELIGLTRVAAHVGCSRSYLARVFRREVGRTVQAYVQQVRLRRALSGMRDGDKIEAVMLDVGYRSKRNFYRLFKNRLGAAPGTFKLKP
jgi:AraC-like DNA-binding protein